MKRILSLAVLCVVFQASLAFAAVVEDWTGVLPGNTGTYQDSNGSKAEFAVDAGPTGGQKALKITANKLANGYVGVYHTVSLDLSKSGSIKFMAKSTVAGDVQLATTDAFHVQYIAKFPVTTAWTQVEIPLSSFVKDPYYTPPDAIAGHPIDWSKTGNLNFSPQMDGASVIEIGPVESAGTASASTGTASTASSAAPATSSNGAAVVVLDWSNIDSKSSGTFQDSKGSTFIFAVKDNPGKKDKKYLTVTYDLKPSGNCGMWARAGGSDWKGATLGGAKSINLLVYSKGSIVLGLALKDNNNNQYVADTPPTKGGKWEAISVPLDSFVLDPYYTPDDAKKGAPKDFSVVKNFNIQPKTEGKFTFAVDTVMAK